MKKSQKILFFLVLLSLTNGLITVTAIPDLIVPDDYSNIQAAIDAALPYDEIYIRPGVYDESLSIDIPLTLTADPMDVTIDGQGAFQVIDVNSIDVILENLIVQNGVDGIALWDAHNAIIDGCVVVSCTDDGIYSTNSYDTWVVDTAVTLCQWGIYFSDSDRAWIRNLECEENTYSGMYFTQCDDLWISDCHTDENGWDGIQLSNCDKAIIDTTVCESNTGSGIEASDCRDLSICEVWCIGNDDGIKLYSCIDPYVSKCLVAGNDCGLDVQSSDLTVVNTEITLNIDEGVNAWQCDPVLRFCSITGNTLGVNTFQSLVDARNCWWGDPGGPYHPVFNPGGLGDEVEDVLFDPWQTSLYQPDVLISDLRCQTDTRWWNTIYPSSESSKPLSTAPAMVSDWLASAFVTTKIMDCDEGLDIDPFFVNQVTGNNEALSGECVLSFGGPVVNPVVKYAETDTTIPGDRAPLKYIGAGGINYFTLFDGTAIPDANLPGSVINNDQDMFIIERYVDSQGRIMMLCYGFGWQGTYAAGKYFESEIFPDLSSFFYSWVVVKWEDTNMDGFVNMPGDDTYTLIDFGV